MRSATPGSMPPCDRRLEALVLREHEKIHDLDTDFQEAWSRREAVHGLYAFQKFREALNRHLGWEEGPLLHAYARRVAEVEPHYLDRHRRQHAQIRKVCLDVLELIGRRIVVGSAMDGDIADRLTALEQLLERHRDGETLGICAALERALDAPELEILAGALEAQPVGPRDAPQHPAPPGT